MDTARKMWRTLEPYHGWIYFVAEAREAYAELGVTGGRMGYFGSRSAPMGAVAAEVVIATFFNFNPSLVHRSIPAVWDITTPEELTQARLRAADAMLRRILGEAVGSEQMREAADLARAGAEACTVEGRPLFAGHARLPWPPEPHLVLWHAVTLLREFRGDGHVVALTAAELDGCQALVTHGAAGEVGPDVLQRSRDWPDEAWQAAVDALRSRGWLDDEDSLSDEGRRQRQAIEDRTDALAMRPWRRLGEDGCDRLRELVRPWSRAIVASGDATPPG